jgi:hypothetical protein
MCTSFGQCVSVGPPDSGPIAMDAGTDAGPRPTDAGPRPTDARVDAGTDAGACGPEVCTPSERGATIADEDCDGAIDEDCEWYFGRPQWLTRPLAAVTPSEANWHFYPELSADGRRLYFMVAEQFGPSRIQRLFVAERPTLDDPFGPSIPVAGTDLASYRVITPALSADELEAWFAATPFGTDNSYDLYHATRASISAPFGPLERIAELSRSDANEEKPWVSPDGLEMIVPSGRQLMRSTRASRTAAWSSMVPLTGIGYPEANTPSMTPDGRVLFFYGRATAGAPERIYYAARADRSSGTFGAPVEASALLPGSGETHLSTPYVSLATREIFYATWEGGWAASAAGLWRAQICRDAACVNTEVPCPAPGVRSPDRLHCYVRGAAETASYETAYSTCLARSRDGISSHLATIHSRAEHDLVWSLRTAAQGVWIGMYDQQPIASLPSIPNCGPRAGATTIPCAFAWVTGEAWTYAAWGLCCGGAGDPSGPGEGCGVLWSGFSVPGDFGDYPCTGAAGAPPTPYVCEDELWPTW